MKFFQIIFLFNVFLFHSLTASIKYQLIDVDIPEKQTSEAGSINNLGQMSGSFKNNDSNYVFIWDFRLKKLNYSSIKATSRPLINNCGEIFGSYWSQVFDGIWNFEQETIFHWQNPFNLFTYFNFKNLGCPNTQYQSNSFDEKKRTVLWDVNDKGQLLVVNSPTIDNEKITDDPKYKVWVYENHIIREITHPFFQAAMKINNHSQILGCFFDIDPVGDDDSIKIPRISIYDLKKDTVKLLEFPNAAVGNDINDKNEVVGIFFDPLHSKIHGFFGEAFSSNFLMIENFSPNALNNRGLIIGKFYEGEKKDKPAIWDNGRVYDLMEVISLVDDKGQTWESLDELIELNDEGYIVGNGTLNGETHAFLLVPTD